MYIDILYIEVYSYTVAIYIRYPHRELSIERDLTLLSIGVAVFISYISIFTRIVYVYIKLIKCVSRNITLYIIANRADKYLHRNGNIGLNSYDHYFIPQTL